MSNLDRARAIYLGEAGWNKRAIARRFGKPETSKIEQKVGDQKQQLQSRTNILVCSH